LGFVLAVVLSAFTIPGFGSLVGAAQWAGDRTRDQLLVLGGSADPLTGIVFAPSASTIRRLLTTLDPQALTVACVAWTLARLREVEQHETHAAQQVAAEQQGAQLGAELKALAMDGKCVRGARRPDGSMPQFMAAVTHERPVVVGQRQIPDKTSEIRAVATLLADLAGAGWDLGSTVVTLDSLHTVRSTARTIVETGANFVMTVKANRATLYAQCAAICARSGQDPDQARDRDVDVQTNRGHGRTEERRVVAVTITEADGIDFPGAAQVFRIVRYTGALHGPRLTKEVVYGITSLTREQAGAAILARLVRGHWQVENGLHYVKDVTLGEDASRARTGHLPAVLSAVRNTVASALRLAGATNIAQTRRWAAGSPERTISLYSADANPGIRTL
jgi:predicted transposase YbfD/YdcC